MIINTLEQIGLDRKQARIYLACLELGEASIKDIAKKSGIKRTTIYDFIDEMVNEGYIKTTSRGVKIKYVAVKPEELRILIKKKEALLAQILPDLKSLSNVGRRRPKMIFYEGAEGLRATYEDTLKYGDKMMYGWASEDILGVLGIDWAMDYIERRVKTGMATQVIMPHTKTMESFYNLDKQHLRESKMVDKQKYPMKIEINIYGSRVAIMSARDKIGLIIESEPIASTMKTIFKLCWDNLK